MAHGRYTIVRKLADGGMAEIFLASQHGAEGFQKPVVLKRVLTAFSADPQFRNMFLDEAHISMGLHHGNIVQVLDVGVAGERAFLVLELVEGWDLGQIIERAQATGPAHPWPPSLALYVTAQLCRALAYAHAKAAPDGRPLGIVHRDVSPHNVLVSEQGEVKLADFGIAKAERKREQTLAGVIKGKIGFMSPEQALGRPLDARADLFSLGAVLYLMLTGRRPFDAASELESLTLAQRAQYRPPEELNPYLSPEATDIVTRTMQRDPAQRYQSADQMLAEVERVLRAQYHSAGQTELKAWLQELGQRDGVAPTGRGAGSAGAGPTFVDASGELSAGSSFELVDVDGRVSTPVAAAPTVVALPISAAAGGTPGETQTTPGGARTGAAAVPTPRGSPSSPSAAASAPSPRASLSPPRTLGPGPVVVGGAPGTPTEGLPPVAQVQVAHGIGATPSVPVAPAVLSNPGAGARVSRRGRAGLGFALGAACMLGAVFGIRWLAQWAGRERSVVADRIGALTDPLSSSPHPPPAGSIAPDGPPVAPPAEDTTGAPPGPVPVAVLAAPAPTSRAEPEAPAGPSRDGGDRGAIAAPVQPAGSSPSLEHLRPAGATASAAEAPTGPVPASAPAGEPAEDEEARLLGRIVPDAGGVVGEDEAEGKPSPSGRPHAGGQSSNQKDHARPVAAGRPADAQGSPARTPRAADASPARAAASRLQAVQVRITTSPLGAVVRTKKQVLGRTPLAIHFKPGNTYELTFVKSGYVTNSRRLNVLPGKPQSISVAMKRAAPQHHGFFRGR